MTPDASSRGFDRRNPSTWNRYAYVLSDPINHGDPTGTDCTTYSQYDSNGNLVTSEDWGCTASSDYYGPAAMGYGCADFWCNTAAQMSQQPSVSISFQYVDVQPNVPAENNYSQNQMQALTAGLNNALQRVGSDSAKCADALSGNDSYMTTLSASFTLSTTLYRILPLTAGAGAATLDSSDVVINATGAFFTAAPNANGTVTVLMPNAQGVQTQFTFASVSDFQGFMLLHELGHQLGTFGPDVDPATNGQNSQVVLDNCFTEPNGVWN